MIDTLKARFLALSTREQRLVLAMIAIAVPVLVWLLVWRPLSSAHDDALDRYRVALDRHGRIAAMTGVEVADARPPVVDGSLATFLLDHAAERGMTLTANQDVAPGRATVTLSTASPADAARWLSALEADGLRIEALQMTPGTDGSAETTATIGGGA